MDENIKNMINAAGVLAEMTKMQYDSLVKAGFSKSDALYLSSEFMKVITTEAFGKPKKD